MYLLACFLRIVFLALKLLVCFLRILFPPSQTVSLFSAFREALVLMVNITADAWTPQGWTSSPNGRGTIDIIWASIVTIFLCTWSVLCINVLAPDETFLKTCLRKVKLAAICGLGPEFLLVLAMGQ